jgi:HK97 gp10 family phage protein
MAVSFEMKTNNVKELLDELKDKKGAALEAIGQAAETYAKLNLESNPRRIDTGNLRGSIGHAPADEDTMCIGTNVEYAPYVELGTRRMTPSHFLKRAASEHTDEYINVIKVHMEE